MRVERQRVDPHFAGAVCATCTPDARTVQARRRSYKPRAFAPKAVCVATSLGKPCRGPGNFFAQRAALYGVQLQWITAIVHAEAVCYDAARLLLLTSGTL